MKKILLLLLCLPITLFSQEIESDPFDDLFSDPEEDIVVIEETVEEILTIVEEKELIGISGFFGGTAGFGVGMVEPLNGFEANNVDVILGAAADSSLTLNINPHKSVRIVGTFSANIDDSNLANPWGNVGLSALFLEYNLLDTALISFGKFDTTVASDFISASSGTSFKIGFPTVLSGLNFLANADASTVVNGQFDFKKMLVGSWVDAVFGSTRLSAGIRYKTEDNLLPGERFSFLLGAQTNIFNINITTELQYATTPTHNLFGNFGLYYVYNNLFVGGKYEAEAELKIKDSLKHYIDVGFRYTSIFDTKLNFNLATKFQIDSLSGCVIPALTMSPFQYVTVSVALPYIFGDDGLEAYENLLDSDYAISIPTELSLLLSVSVDIPF